MLAEPHFSLETNSITNSICPKLVSLVLYIRINMAELGNPTLKNDPTMFEACNRPMIDDEEHEHPTC